MKILPLGKNSYQTENIIIEIHIPQHSDDPTHPKPDIIEYKDVPGTIEISDEDFLGLKNKTKCFNEDLTAVVDYYETERERQEKIILRVEELKQLLANSDYKAIKYSEGLISDEEYEPIKLQRQAWREEINQYQNK